MYLGYPCDSTYPVFTVTPFFARSLVLLLVITGACSSGAAYAQADYEATLLYREKKLFSPERYVIVTFSDAEGNPSPSPASFHDSQFLYFSYRPRGTWELDIKDLSEGLNTIKIEQGERVVRAELLSPASRTKTFDYAVAAFSRDSLDLYRPMLISNDLAPAERALTFGEAYYPGYARYLSAFEMGRTTAGATPIQAMGHLLPFAEASDSVRVFSFYEDAVRQLHEVARRPVARVQESSASLQSRLTASEVDAAVLAEAAQADTNLVALRDSLSGYLELPGQEARRLREQLDAIRSSLASNTANAADRYRISRLSFLESGSYDDFKFRTFVDVLVRLLLYRDQALSPVAPLTRLPIEALDQMPRQTRLLADLGWRDEFDEVAGLLSDQIQSQNSLLGRGALINLINQRRNERQPYYHLFKAFDSQVEGNDEEAVANFERALAKATDRALIDSIQLWLIAFDLKQRPAPQAALDLVNEGIRMENDAQLSEARDQFVRATRLYSTFAPAYYHLGRVTLAKDGNSFAARTYFDRAVENDSGYVAPRLADIQLHVDAGESDLALQKLDLAVAKREMWYFHYLRARTLYQLKRYEDALAVLQNQAIPLVPMSFEQFILLGDISLATNAADQARTHYLDAGRMEPENERFREAMERLPSQQR